MLDLDPWLDASQAVSSSTNLPLRVTVKSDHGESAQEVEVLVLTYFPPLG